MLSHHLKVLSLAIPAKLFLDFLVCLNYQFGLFNSFNYTGVYWPRTNLSCYNSKIVANLVKIGGDLLFWLKFSNVSFKSFDFFIPGKLFLLLNFKFLIMKWNYNQSLSIIRENIASIHFLIPCQLRHRISHKNALLFLLSKDINENPNCFLVLYHQCIKEVS